MNFHTSAPKAASPAGAETGEVPAFRCFLTPDIIEDGYDHRVEIGTDNPLGMKALQERQGQDEEGPRLPK